MGRLADFYLLMYHKKAAKRGDHISYMDPVCMGDEKKLPLKSIINIVWKDCYSPWGAYISWRIPAPLSSEDIFYP